MADFKLKEAMSIAANNGYKFTFIDLFAGLGGFHLAMRKLGGKCVFASELKPDLQELYKKNFGMECSGDITKIDIHKEIPKYFDILCAGFPCQPFSKSGKQQGFDDDQGRGNLFWVIMEILKVKKPEFILLENVQNLETHDGGNTWAIIKKKLETMYEVNWDVLSPHEFEIPQHRKRIYIVGRLLAMGGLKHFEFPSHRGNKECSIKKIIDENEKNYMHLRPQTRIQLKAWEHFLKLLKKNKIKIPSFPIWTMEWGATYDYEGKPPCQQSVNDFKGKKGEFGNIIVGDNIDDILPQLPIYSQVTITDPNEQFPDWKKNFIKWNREFYLDNKTVLDEWLPEIQQEGFENSHQKFEWNCGKDKNVKPTLKDKIIQFRPSGIRVKLPTYSPALVLTTTQIPIFPWIKTPEGEIGRYMTKKEAAKLQCMEELENVPNTISEAFKAFGNAVNVEVVRRIAENLLEIK